MKNARRILVGILLALVLSVMPVVPAFADDFAEVEITATPAFIAMTNSVDSWPLSTVYKQTTYWWTAAGTAPDPEPFEADDMKSIITNTGSVAENIHIEATDFTGVVGWTLASSAGENEVILAAGKTGTTNKAAMLKLINATPQELVHELPHTTLNTIGWCMYLETGTFTDGSLKTSVVTLTASEHTP